MNKKIIISIIAGMSIVTILISLAFFVYQKPANEILELGQQLLERQVIGPDTKIADKQWFDQAVDNQNPNLCGKIKQAVIKKYCYEQFIKKQEAAVCAQIEDDKWSDVCYHDLAMLKSNVALCQEINSRNKKQNCLNFLKKAEITLANVSGGHLIAYGQYIPPPYEVRLSKNMIYINGVQCIPQLKRVSDDEIRASIKVTETQRQIHQIGGKIFSNYHIWMIQYGQEKTQGLLTDYLKQQDLIESFEFQTDGNLEVKWKDEQWNEEIWLSTAGQKGISEEEKIEGWIERVDRLVEFLNNDSLLIYDYKVNSIIPNGSSTLNKINEIMKMNIDRQQKESKLMEIIYRQDAVDSVLDNF